MNMYKPQPDNVVFTNLNAAKTLAAATVALSCLFGANDWNYLCVHRNKSCNNQEKVVVSEIMRLAKAIFPYDMMDENRKYNIKTLR